MEVVETGNDRCLNKFQSW